MSDNTAFLLIIAGILIVLSMFFSASESAFFSVNKLRIRFLRNKKNKAAIRVGKLLDNKDKLLSTILVGNNIVNISLSSILTSIALTAFGSAGVGYATLTATILLLLFGEIAPKTLGTQHPELIAFKFSPLLLFFSAVFHPLILFFSGISRGLAKLTGASLNAQQVSFTEEEIKTLIEMGEEEGVLEESEKRMMHRVFSFTDLAAKDIMTPRTDIITIFDTATYNDVVETAQKSQLSYFPVLGKNIDDIKGVLYIKDMLSYSGDPQNFSIKKLMRPPLFILETKNMSSVQQLLKEKTQSIAIVLDEYSGTSGILTKEDIAREIFGTVIDEYNALTEIPEIIIKDSQASVSGKARLSDISEKLEINLQSEYNETIGGFIMETLDGMAHEGDYIIKDGWRFTVESVSKRRITHVHIKPEEL
ncbi:MAG: hemolysin family protein [Spirochaetales bacterium]